MVSVQCSLPRALVEDVTEIAPEITVRVNKENSAGGSGFIVQRSGNTYTVLTNWHVVDRPGKYSVKTKDGLEHQVRYDQIQELPGVDLAVMSFISSQDYRVAELGDSDDVKLTDTVYVSGWLNPLSDDVLKPTYSLIEGQMTSVQEPNDGGYELVYNTDGNFLGMSGGPVLTEDGKAIGVNGQGISHPIPGMVGLYLGIPINTFERLYGKVPPPTNAETEGRMPSFISILVWIPMIGVPFFLVWVFALSSRRTNRNKDVTTYRKRSDAYRKPVEERKNIANDNQNRGNAYRKPVEDRKNIANDQAIRPNLDDAKAYFKRGVVYYCLTHYQKAIGYYTEAIRLNPDDANADANAYYNRGLAYLNQRDYDKAIADYNQAIRLNPDDALAYIGRGFAYDDLGEYQKAIADYNQAIRVNPEYVEAYVGRGIAYKNQGEYQKAIADYNQAIRLNPDLAEPYIGRGLVYREQGKYQKEIANYSQAIQINQNWRNLSPADTYNNRGNAYRKQGDYQKAIADFTEAIRLKPDDANVYYNRANAYKNQKNNPQALEDLRKAAELFQQQGKQEDYQDALKKIRELE